MPGVGSIPQPRSILTSPNKMSQKVEVAAFPECKAAEFASAIQKEAERCIR